MLLSILDQFASGTDDGQAPQKIRPPRGGRFPMEPGRCFALRRAIADRRLRILKRPTTALGAARTARVERPGVQRVRRVIAEMPARLTHWPATSSCALAFSAGASRRERTWRKMESPGK